MNLPVDASDGGVLAKRCGMLLGILPELLALLHIVWGVERVVDADDDEQGPSKRHQNTVGVQGMGAVSVPAGEGVVEWHGGG